MSENIVSTYFFFVAISKSRIIPCLMVYTIYIGNLCLHFLWPTIRAVATATARKALRAQSKWNPTEIMKIV